MLKFKKIIPAQKVKGTGLPTLASDCWAQTACPKGLPASKPDGLRTNLILYSLLFYRIDKYEGESNENLKSAITIPNTARLSVT